MQSYNPLARERNANYVKLLTTFDSGEGESAVWHALYLVLVIVNWNDF